MPWLPTFTSLPVFQSAPPGTDAWPGGITVDDPLWGRRVGPDALAAFIADSEAWLHERAARVRPVAVTASGRRTVAEYDLELRCDGDSLVLPIAAVVEVAAPIEVRALALRIYHSLWPLLGRHELRPPLLPRDPDAGESDVVARYQEALAAGDAEAITATFEEDGCFREPSGPQHRVCGRDALRPFFTGFFRNGGITLEHCAVTEDGVRTALEFNAVRWGTTDLPPQAGVAVYERGESGLLRQARVYDDVDPPLDA